MALVPGSCLGPYEVIGLLGVGGMGEVYRAYDTRLKRAVALKVLPESCAADPERLARFQREAEVLASLDHPNIAGLYGLEQVDGTPALIMQLVDGETLAERVARGPVPVDEALAIAHSIAAALESAHEHGIIHRDLKPANVKLTPDGTVKVLDFGLAKLAEPAGAAMQGASPLSGAPTIASPALMTKVGAPLGTVAYMSPEQARGYNVDKRTDVWALGCVLYELLTGQTAFDGATVSDTVAAVLGRDPDWGRLPDATPPLVRRLLSRCVAKDLKGRMRDIGDVRLAIEDAQSGSARIEPIAARSIWRSPRLAWMLVVTLLVALAAVIAWHTSSPRSPLAELRVELTTPPTRDPISLAIAPDGRRVVFAATSGDRQQLWMRSLDAGTAKPLPGTEAARFPFWSPDGRSIGFFADGKLRRVDIDGGASTILADAPLGQGGAWNRDGTVLFAPAPASAILQVPASGGQPSAVTALAGPQQVGHSFPQFLPDGRHFLYYAEGADDTRGVYVGGLASTETKRLVDADAAAVYSPRGHLVFVRLGMLHAQPFDLDTLALTGTPVQLGQQPAIQRPAAALSISSDGALVYRTGAAGDERAYVWFDRSGKEIGRLNTPPGAVRSAPAFSPDGRTLVMHTVSGNADLWLVDIERAVFKRFTEHAADDILPIWSRDGARIAFSSTRTGDLNLYLKSAAGTGDEELLLNRPGTEALSDWSPDGRWLLYSSGDPQTGFDIWILRVDGDRTPVPVVQTKFNERMAQFSPDGKWIAYESNESGRYEIYLQRLSAEYRSIGGAVPVSTNGGAQVRWRPDGQALYYLALDDRLMMVPITVSTDQTSHVGRPIALFSTRVADGAQQPFARYQYTVSPDGQRFLMNTLTEGGTAPITLLLNWNPKP